MLDRSQLFRISGVESMSCGNRRVTLCLPTVLLLSGLLSASEPSPTLDSDAPYRAERTNPVTYQVEFLVTVTAPYKSKKLEVWLPIPQSDFGQEVSDSRISTFPMTVAAKIDHEPLFGNKFAYFAFDNPQGAQVIRHQFSVKVWELRWNLDASRVQSISEWPKSFDRYRRAEQQAVVVDQRFDKLLAEIVPQRNGPLRDFEQVFGWVHRNFEYDHVDASLRADSLHGLEKRRGHCSDYHGLCAAMGRVLGTPTRVTYGINTFPKNSPSHCKLEAFLPPYGWVSFDVSETQKLIADIQKNGELSESNRQQLIAVAQRRLTRGFRDNTWYLQTRGTDYDLVPKASRRVPVVRTIYAEADGVPLPDPDPANKKQHEYAWMTAHQYVSDKPVRYPFTDWKSLEADTPSAVTR
jgi:transglutaminase-like putative cysteine protease